MHFYTGADVSWNDYQRNRVQQYVQGGFPIFITEYGVSAADGGSNGQIYTDQANKLQVSFIFYGSSPGRRPKGVVSRDLGKLAQRLVQKTRHDVVTGLEIVASQPNLKAVLIDPSRTVVRTVNYGYDFGYGPHYGAATDL